MSSALAQLGLADDATLEQVKLAYRNKARELHPDAGGDPEAFHALKVIYNEAVQAVENRACYTCGGSGKVVHTAGFHSITMPCPTCKGMP